MITAEQIADLYRRRLERAGPLIRRIREVRDVYNGDVVLPLPELSKHEKASVANLTQLGIEQLGSRIASVLPTINYPPFKPGQQKSEKLADTRRRVNYGWWEKNRIRKILQRRSRWYLGYGIAPVIIRPSVRFEGPRWDARSPLDVFPSRGVIDEYTPDNIIVTHSRDFGWIARNYPEAALRVHKSDPESLKPEDRFTVLEYIDHDEIVFVVLGQEPRDEYDQPTPESMSVELTRRPNRAGICWGVLPTRVTLDRPLGHFDGITGMFETQAALMAMNIIATRRAIWPREWLVANPNEVPQVIQEPDPSTGTPGVLKGGRIDRQQIDPSFQAQTVIDRLEYSMRQTASLPAELGGAGSTNVRTGRKTSLMIGASIDFTIANAQDAFAESLQEENRRAIAIDKAYHNKRKIFHVATKGARGLVEYKPSEVWETDQHVVEYPLAGTDLSDLVINGGQRVGMETMSKRSFMEIDPLISDADAEEHRIRLETLERAFFTNVLELAAQPDGPFQPIHFARLAKKMADGDTPWYKAIDELQRELQEEQAEGAEPGSPETMPGLSMPGQGAEIPAIGQPGPSMNNLTQLLGQLGTAQQAMRFR